MQKVVRSTMDDGVTRGNVPRDATAIAAICKDIRVKIRASILKLYVKKGEPDWGVPRKLAGRRFDCAGASTTFPEYMDRTVGSQLTSFFVPGQGWGSNSIVESSHQAGWREQAKKAPVAGGAPEHFTSMKIGVFGHSANSKLRLKKAAAKAAGVAFNAIAPREVWLTMMGAASPSASPVLFAGNIRRLRQHALENLRSSDYYQKNKHKVNTVKNQHEIDKAEETREAGVHKLALHKKNLGVVETDAADVLPPDIDEAEDDEINENGDGPDDDDDDGEGCYKGAATDALCADGHHGALVQVGLAPPGPAGAPPPAGETVDPAPARKRRRAQPALPKPSRTATRKPGRASQTLVAASRALLGEARRAAPSQISKKPATKRSRKKPAPKSRRKAGNGGKDTPMKGSK